MKKDRQKKNFVQKIKGAFNKFNDFVNPIKTPEMRRKW